MRGDYFPPLPREEHPGKGQTLPRGFGREVTGPELRCYPHGNVLVSCWPAARKEVHVLCKHFVDVAELTAPSETEPDLPEDNILHGGRQPLKPQI